MRSHRFLAASVALAVPIAGCLAPPDSKRVEPPAEDATAEAQQPVVTCACTPPSGATCSGSGPTGYNPYKVAYFGDLHLHTSYSLDAYAFGTRSDPSNAYLFAKSQATVDVGAATSDDPGPTISQPRKLDFLAITDHSEFLAMTHGCVLDPESGYYDTSNCGLVRSENAAAQAMVFVGLAAGNLNNDFCDGDGDPADCAAQVEDAWQETICAAQCAYDPCSFTSLVAYEWTDMQGTSTDHRNVIFGSASVPQAPLSSLDYPDPPALWTGLDGACTAGSGCEVVAIPHNSNQSDGVTLQIWDPSPNGIRQQQQYQVSAEIYQHKGASECDANVPEWANEEECKFETLSTATDPPPASSFVRHALKEGIASAAASPSQGNPLKLGFVGATDDHNGAPGYTDETLFVGHLGRMDDSALKRVKSNSQYSGFGSGGLTGVWAEQNTRESIFAGVKRRETFATSGPRMQVRFFQTSNLAPCTDAAFPKKIVDAGAVTMGGTFGPGTIGIGKPKFAIWAWPDSWPQQLANGQSGVALIDAVQVIKAHTSVVNGQTTIVEDPPVTVPAFPANGGCVKWTDDAWATSTSPGEYAFYYVRVLQQETQRWSHNDCAAVKAEYPATWQTRAPGCATGGGLDVTVKERAWTSPIWYEPG